MTKETEPALDKPLTNLSELERSITYFRRREELFRGKANTARLQLRDCVEAAVKVHGMTEVRAAELANVTRMTVRSWLGK